MKILLAIIITATFSFGCGVFEEEQTTADTGGEGTTSAPTGGAEAGATSPRPNLSLTWFSSEEPSINHFVFGRRIASS